MKYSENEILYNELVNNLEIYVLTQFNLTNEIDYEISKLKYITIYEIHKTMLSTVCGYIHIN